MMGARVLEGPKFRYSISEKTLGEFFFNSIEKHKDRVCQIDANIDKTEAYDSVKRRSTRVAITLKNREITSKDLIAFCSGNTLDNTIPVLATFYIGAKVAAFEPTLSVEYTKHLLNSVTPKMIFVEEASVSLIEQCLEDANFQTEIVVFGQSTKYSVFSDFLKTQKNEKKFKPTKVDPNEVALVIFSSGTTGMPKAISHSHRSFLSNILRTYQIGARFATLHFSTLYALAPFMVMGSCFKAGTYRVFARDTNPANICAIIEKYMISYFFATSVVIHKLINCKEVTKYDTSSLKILVCSSFSSPLSHLEQLAQLFPTVHVITSYVMVEIGLISLFDTETDVPLIKTHFTSCGKVLPGCQLKVVNVDTGKTLGPNEKGEIRIKSTTIMIGYYKGDCSKMFDEEGFLKTGDIGYYDKDDCVYVAERLKDMIKYQKGYIIPSTIEGVLLQHPAIKEAVVFGIPRDKVGEVPAAGVVLKEGYQLTEKDIDKFLKEKVSDKERLRGGVTFFSSLPRTPTDKIVKQEVRDRILGSIKK